jgi:ADP-heptose:LPS heptosyltransferase
VARALADAGHRVVVTGSDAERDLTAAVADAAGGEDLGGRTDLAGLLDVVASARLVLAGDTGISHVATAFATPSVTLFGPVGPEQWGPPPHGPHVTLTHPERRRGERFAGDPDPALLAVTVEEALRAGERLLDP